MTKAEVRELFGHDEVRNLFLWHALEESEHKAVAFDVYRAVGGTERMRVWTMKAIRVGFIAGLTIEMIVSLARDRETYRPGVLRKSWRRFKGSPLMSRDLWDQLKEYDKANFHPDDRDTSALVERWREELFGATGTLNDKLASSVA